MDILFEDQDILVVKKPAGLPTQSASVSQKDMVSEIKGYLKTQDNKDLYAGLVHRLDQPVEGILIFAKNQAAAADLSRQVSSNQMKKQYYALVEGIVTENERRLVDYLLKDSKINRAVVVSEKTPGAKRAELILQVCAVDRENNRSLLKIQLLTGRFHQIRAQLSHLGYPIINDTKYGKKEEGNSKNGYQIALCAYQLEFKHPKTKKQMQLEIEPTAESIRELWAQLPD